MRREFARQLYELMQWDEHLFLVTADVGYGMFDAIRTDFPDQFLNVGAAEQVAMDIAVGLTLAGKRAIFYSITPFLLFRPFESIRNYVDHEQLPVILVGSGRGNEYEAGFSHDASDDLILKCLKNVVYLSPNTDFSLREILEMNKPVYLNLKR
jgi:transketolase